MRSTIFRSGLGLMLGLVSIALAAGCRQQMADQPRYDPLQQSTFYADGLSARPLPAGTVARNFKEPDELLDRGRVGDHLADRIPVPITMDLLRRGQQRYNIFCVPCHDYVGTGRGMAVLRGFRTHPTSFHTDEMKDALSGHIFDVITNGLGAMPSYANQIAAPDRWAVVAYIRALQLSQSASTADVPPDVLQRLEAEKR